MKRLSAIFGLLRDESGTSVTEFVVIAPLFFILFFGIFEFGLAFYWAKGLEKAAQLGARLAVVSDPLVALPAQTPAGANAVFGTLCSDASNPCTPFEQLVYTCAPACTGNPIVDRMREIFPPLESDGSITIAYRYARLGFVGGPTVPSVTVTISGAKPPLVPFSVFLDFVAALLREEPGSAGSATLPDIRATLTGEDLDT